MYVGKTMFAQLMDFLPWTSFGCIVAEYGGNAGVRSFPCTEQFRAMAFAQLTWRESLRDIEVCLAAHSSKLYAMGFRQPVKRSTLADVAALLIQRARKLYCNEALSVDLDNTVYALDSTTINLCLSLFEWAPFRSTKAAIKLHTLLDILPIEAGAFYVMDRGYLDFERLYALHKQSTFFVTRAKRGMDARRVCSMPVDRAQGLICDQRIALMFLCMLAYYVEFHLRKDWGELLYTDEKGPIRTSPVAPVQPSPSGSEKKAKAHTHSGLPLQSFGGLMKSLATLALTRIRLGDKGPLYTRTTKPTPLQARAFELIGIEIA